MNVVDLIMTCAKVPSFSSYEERIHPLIKEICSKVASATIVEVPDNNLIIKIPGKRNLPPVAITAHLDKINHFGVTYPAELPTHTDGTNIWGVMDDTAGLGICLATMFLSEQHDMPPLYILFSEMEEGTDLRNRPHLMKNNGEGYMYGMGAERIAKYLLTLDQPPVAIITIDTTPKFKGKSGIALYNQFWHREEDFEVSTRLQDLTNTLQNYFTELYPAMLIGNANNDYIEYGKVLNKNTPYDIPSIAIEPAINPYHAANEGVFCKDVEMIVTMLTQFLSTYDFAAFTNKNSVA